MSPSEMLRDEEGGIFFSDDENSRDGDSMLEADKYKKLFSVDDDFVFPPAEPEPPIEPPKVNIEEDKKIAIPKKIQPPPVQKPSVTSTTEFQNELFHAFLHGSEHEYIREKCKNDPKFLTYYEQNSTIETVESLIVKSVPHPFQNKEPHAHLGLSYFKRISPIQFETNSIDATEIVGQKRKERDAVSEHFLTKKAKIDSSPHNAPTVLLNTLQEIIDSGSIPTFIKDKWKKGDSHSNKRNKKSTPQNKSQITTPVVAFKFESAQDFILWFSKRVFFPRSASASARKPQRLDFPLICAETVRLLGTMSLNTLSKILLHEGMVKKQSSLSVILENPSNVEYNIRIALQNKYSQLQEFRLPKKLEFTIVPSNSIESQTPPVIASVLLVRSIIVMLTMMLIKKKIARWITKAYALEEKEYTLTSVHELINRMIYLVCCENNITQTKLTIKIMASELERQMPIIMIQELRELIYIKCSE